MTQLCSGLPQRYRPPVQGAVDPFFANVVMLSHFDGANGSQTFTNVIGANPNFVASGAAALTTANFKFGTASINRISGSIVAAPSAAWNLGVADLSLDCWLYITALPNPSNVFCDFRAVMGAAPLRPILTITNAGAFQLYVDPSVRISGGSIALNTWTYFNWSRVAAVSRFYVGTVGVANQIGADYADTNNYISGNLSFLSDAYATQLSSGGGDEFRLTAGNGRGNSGASIPVPTSAFPNQ